MAAKTFTSVWARKRKERDQGLSRDHIVRATIELLDAEGLDALSMRKLGARLGAGATSLYWYVESKDELLELVMDEIYGMVTVPENAGWREAAAAFAYGLRAAILAHPWCTGLIGALPALGPNALDTTDRLMDAFEAGGFTGLDVDYAVSAVMAYTLGATIPEAALRTALAKTGTDDAAFQEAISSLMEKLTSDRPRLRERYLEYAKPGFDRLAARSLCFDFGLVSVLDGLAARLAQPS